MTTPSFTIEQAFERLLLSPAYWRKTGRPMYQRRSFLHKLATNQGISLDLKKQLLQSAGFSVHQKETWHVPTRR